jgi:subtilase family serine protease
MLPSFWEWLTGRPQASSRRPSPTGRRGKRPRLDVEALETRDLLATFAPFYVLRSDDGGVTPFSSPSPTGTTPMQIRHAYGFDQITFSNGTVTGDGSGTTIAIVDAYDDPNIANDLHQFDLRFNLPDPTFTKVSQTGSTTSLPAPNPGWASEIALDVEWAHAIAPGAAILLVEANSSSDSDLFTAVRYAASRPGVVAVSMSWGSGEFSGETSFDSSLTTPSGHAGVTFVVSSGDRGAPASYPSASPNVLSVGGTRLVLTSSGTISSETGWGGSGGGISAIESQPSYQQGIVISNGSGTVNPNGKRATPDVSYDSDPSTGFPVYDTYNNLTTAPWSQFGGTSDAAPQWAALIAIADQGRALASLGSLDGRSQTLPMLYALSSSAFHDITGGTSTGSPNYSAGTGYDLVTGRGSPVANLVVQGLVGDTLTLAAVPDQTVASGGTLTVTLSGSDTLGRPITYSGSAVSIGYALDQTYGFYNTNGNLYFNYGGRQDKWFQGGSNGAWYFILPSGGVYLWDGTVNQASGTLIATVDTSYYTNPATLYNATPGPSNATVTANGNVLTIIPNTGFVGTFAVLVNATDGIASANEFFRVTVTGTVGTLTLTQPANATIVHNTSYAVTLSATDTAGRTVAFSATVQSQAYQLRQQYGFYSSDGNLYFDYGGLGDKWFQGNGGVWYFILPSGGVYLWDGTANQASGTQVATLQTAYYSDPSLLYNASVGATTSVSGSQLTVTPSTNFVGLLYVTATASDGVLTDSKTFTITVT